MSYPLGDEVKFVWDVPDDVVASAYERFEVREELFEMRPS